MITVEINGISEQGQSASIKTASRIGFVKTFAGTTPPEGTLLCDGSAVSRDTYSDLFDVIGTTWGEGDGTSTFNLPDLRDVWILCAGTEHEAGDSVAEGLPNITGAFAIRENGTGSVLSPNATVIDAGAFYIGTPPGSFNDCTQAVVSSSNGTRVQMDASRSSAIYGASDHVTPASVAVLPCIVYE